jgi:hypothetical protein
MDLLDFQQQVNSTGCVMFHEIDKPECYQLVVCSKPMHIIAPPLGVHNRCLSAGAV